MQAHNNKSISPYLNSKRYNKKMDRYDVIIERIGKSIVEGKQYTLLDIGCGDAALTYQIKEKFKNIKCNGLEYNKTLIDQCSENELLDDITFFQGDACDFNLAEKFDIIIMSGVLSIFDEPQWPLKCMINHMNPGGLGVIFTRACSAENDVLIKFRNTYHGRSEWETGLNMFSINTLKSEIEKLGVNGVHFEQFNLSINLEKTEDPTRGYTIETKDGGNLIVNGMNIMSEYYTVSFSI